MQLTNLLLTLLIVSVACSSEDVVSDGPTVVAYVDGEPIDAREFQQQLRAVRAETLRYFTERHGVFDTNRFWESSFGGERPLDVAKQRAMKLLVDRKVRQVVMKQHGILSDTTYSAFLERWAGENEHRNRRVRNGEPVYGPTHVEEAEYLTYELTNAETAVKERLFAQMPPPTSEELATEYDRIRDSLVQRTTRTARMIRFDYGAPVTKARVEGQARRLWERIKGGENAELAVKAFPEAKVTMETFVVDARQRRPRRERFEDALEGLDEGQAGKIVETSGALVILVGIDVAKQYLPLAQAIPAVTRSLMHRRYEAMIAARVANAKVRVNAELSAAITAAAL
jgi:hypothetical protein